MEKTSTSDWPEGDVLVEGDGIAIIHEAKPSSPGREKTLYTVVRFDQDEAPGIVTSRASFHTRGAAQEYYNRLVELMSR